MTLKQLYTEIFEFRSEFYRYTELPSFFMRVWNLKLHGRFPHTNQYYYKITIIAILFDWLSMTKVLKLTNRIFFLSIIDRIAISKLITHYYRKLWILYDIKWN